MRKKIRFSHKGSREKESKLSVKKSVNQTKLNIFVGKTFFTASFFPVLIQKILYLGKCSTRRNILLLLLLYITYYTIVFP